MRQVLRRSEPSQPKKPTAGKRGHAADSHLIGVALGKAVAVGSDGCASRRLSRQSKQCTVESAKGGRCRASGNP